ncbi:GIY-YIG nuclease family protein [Pseudomonas syringae pv. actinidiae]|nr:GIY-YIG nuclease family protein [Pseudomonas syringae pv. actinidiae]
MAQFYYQLKGHKVIEYYGDTGWFPIFTGLIEASDKKSAKLAIEDEYGRQFPTRLLRKDVTEKSVLLYISEITVDQHDYRLRRFEDIECKECSGIFKIIEKYNDPFCDYKGPDYCSRKCYDVGRHRDVQAFRLASDGKVPPVIYQITQLSTQKVYIGQTIQPFTLRWWQHLTQHGESKFHEAIKSTTPVDWTFQVVEVIEFPEGCDNKVAYITDRERHWIDKMNSVTDGYNTVRPSFLSTQQSLLLDAESMC